MFSSTSYRVLFQSFFPQNISLLPKIVTEAHANLKKKKTSCNTTLKHYAVMVKNTPLECSSPSSLICKPVVFFPIYSSSEFIWAVVHYYIVDIFPWRSIILWTKRRPGSRTCSSCLTSGLMAWDQTYKSYLEKLLKPQNDLFALFRPSIFLSEISIQILYSLTPVFYR